MNFELAEVAPVGANFKMYFVQCVSCGTPVGVVPFYDLHTSIKALEKEVKKIEAQINMALPTLDHNIRVIAQKLK